MALKMKHLKRLFVILSILYTGYAVYEYFFTEEYPLMKYGSDKENYGEMCREIGLDKGIVLHVTNAKTREKHAVECDKL
jgi:hypothetical protein